MINVEKALAHLDAAPGDAVIYSKTQMRQLLAEVSKGQQASTALVGLRKSIAAAAAPFGLAA